MNLLFYADNLSDTQTIVASLNSNTTTSKTTAINSGGIERFGLMFRNNGLNKIPFMFTNSKFAQYNWFSDALINFLVTNNIKTLDIISCNTNITTFNRECASIYAKYGITINHALTKIGNVGNADWLLTLNNLPQQDQQSQQGQQAVNLKTLYFTEKIDNWEFDLDFSDLITYIGSENISITSMGMSTYYRLLHNITLDFTNQHYSNLYAGDIFDGNNKTITIINSGLNGLFSVSTDLSNPAIIKDLTVKSPSTYDGGIVIGTSSGFKVLNCSFHGIIQGAYQGDCSTLELIVGSGGIIGFGSSDFIAIGCKSYGTIMSNAGGICGYGCQNYTIIDCHNYATVNGDFAGGICGCGLLIFDVSTNQYNKIKKCTNNANVTGQGAGGIYGAFCSFNDNYISSVNVKTVIYDCINNGQVVGIGSGGICGLACGIVDNDFTIDIPLSGATSNVVIIKCKNYGDVGIECGGICGGRCAYIGSNINRVINSLSYVYIKKCTNYGNVLNIGGGIIGRFSCNNTTDDAGSFSVIVVHGCKCYGSIYNGSGAVCGPDSFQHQSTTTNSILTIENCHIKSIQHKNTAVFLGNNCAGYNQTALMPAIIINNNKYNTKYVKYLNLVAGTVVEYSP